jgi:putative hemolysin
VKYLPISKTVLSSLSEMRRERAHLAIVVDEYGGTVASSRWRTWSRS